MTRLGDEVDHAGDRVRTISRCSPSLRTSIRPIAPEGIKLTSTMLTPPPDVTIRLPLSSTSVRCGPSPRRLTEAILSLPCARASNWLASPSIHAREACRELAGEACIGMRSPLASMMWAVLGPNDDWLLSNGETEGGHRGHVLLGLYLCSQSSGVVERSGCIAEQTLPQTRREVPCCKSR